MQTRPFLSRPVALLLVVGLALTGCSSDADTGDSRRGSDDQPAAVFPPPIGSGQIPLIERFTNRLVVFDVDQARIVSAPRTDQRFEYALPGRSASTIITSGDSDESGSALVELTDDGVRVIEDLDRAAFPLARDGDTTYLQLSTVRTDGKLGSSSLARYTAGGSVKAIADLPTQITHAVIADDRLWYTTYDEKSDRYDLWSASLEGAFEPRSERSGLRTGRLFTVGGKLVTNDAFGPGMPRVDCSLHCLVDDDGGYVFSLVTGDASLQVSALNLDSGATKTLAEGEIIDFFTRGSVLEIYQTGAVTTVKSQDLP